MERGRKTKREKSCVIQSAKDNGGRTRGKNSGTEASTLSNIQSEKGPTKRKEKWIIMTNKKTDFPPPNPPTMQQTTPQTVAKGNETTWHKMKSYYKLCKDKAMQRLPFLR